MGDPQDRKPLAPVGWLLGPELIAQAGRILRNPRDPRQWMTPDVGYVHDENLASDGSLVEACKGQPPGDEREVVWFDYIADTGDGGDAMYAIAYACQVDLELLGQGPLPTSLPEEQRVEVWRSGQRAQRRGNLPRGQFLFIGGDSAYHVADVRTIRARVETPFKWAAEDLGDDRVPEPARLYGIPGNHDWYDDLQGFSLLFRGGSNPDAVDLPGFARVQVASYMAIQLPHGWRLWGLDIYNAMDQSQRRYFECLLQPEPPRDPERLILCTQSPPVALGIVMAEKNHREALGALGLTEAYLPGAPLPDGRCRLDLSGDIHHYARYPSPEGASSGYTSVVAGLGGAFHHPTFPHAGRRVPVAEYPTVAQSRQAISGRLLAFDAAMGSWVLWVSMLLTCMLGAATLQTGGLGWLFDRLFSLIGLGTATRGEPLELARLFMLLGVIAAGVVWVVFGLRALTRLVARLRPGPEAPPESPTVADAFWGPILPFGIVSTALLLVWFSFSRFAPTSSTVLDSVAVVLMLGVWAGCLLGAIFVGNKYVESWRRRVGVGVLGFFHGMIQVVTALLCARLVAVSYLTLGVTVAIWFVCTRLLLPLARWPFARNRPSGVLAVAAFSWVGCMAALIFAARGQTVTGGPVWLTLLRFVAGGVAASRLSGVIFLWYFAIAGLLGGHNNEVGAAAKISRFRQLIRFRVDASGLTGYVISVEDDGQSPAQKGGVNLRFRLEDVFVVSPGAASTSPPA